MNIIQRIGDQLASIVPGVPIYRENQKGGFKEPSFFVSSINTDVKPELFERQKRTYSYQAVYFPKLKQTKSDMEAMQETLLDHFTVLNEFAYIRNRTFNEVDNTLTMTFNVVLWAKPVEVGPKLKTMEYHGVIAYDK